MDLGNFLELDGLAGDLVRINRPITTDYEIANVAHALEGKLALFSDVQNYPGWRVLAGPCSDRRFFALALGVPPSGLLNRLVSAVNKPQSPPVIESGPCQEVILPNVDLGLLPILRHLPEDAGPYMTSAVVIVHDPELGRNVAYHRMLRLNAGEFAVRLVEGRGTHTAWTKSQGDLPCAICVGLPLQVNLAAAMSPPPGVDELGIAHALVPTPLVRCKTADLCVPAEAELVLEGRITKRFTDEGPFPDLTETMDLIRPGQIIKVDLITRRRQPIYHALLPGGLEHKLLMGMPREPTIFAEINRVAKCTDVLVTPGGASWLHAVVQIDKQGPDDGMMAIHAAFKGHGSLKHVVVVDTDVDISRLSEVEWAIATRFQADKDLVVLADQPGSSLDPSGVHAPGKKARTAKMGLDATRPWNSDCAKFSKIRYKDVQLDRYTT